MNKDQYQKKMSLYAMFVSEANFDDNNAVIPMTLKPLMKNIVQLRVIGSTQKGYTIPLNLG